MYETKVKDYSDESLINQIKKYNIGSLPDYLLVGIRSNEDTPNVFDDKLYLFINGTCRLVASCTTNAGTPALLGGWKTYNKKGVAVIAPNKIYKNAYLKSGSKIKDWVVPKHKGKIDALIQVGTMDYYRDNNDNDKVDYIGNIETANNSTNVHFDSYDLLTRVKKMFINGWSEGCIVLNDLEDYKKLLTLVPLNVSVSLIVLDEF